MTAHQPPPRAAKDEASLDAFFAEADDILTNWVPQVDAGTWAADGSHQPARIRGDYFANDRQRATEHDPGPMALTAAELIRQLRARQLVNPPAEWVDTGVSSEAALAQWDTAMLALLQCGCPVCRGAHTYLNGIMSLLGPTSEATLVAVRMAITYLEQAHERPRAPGNPEIRLAVIDPFVRYVAPGQTEEIVTRTAEVIEVIVLDLRS